MKKEKAFRDSRFDVSHETEVINEIKKNNKTLELLDNLQEIIEFLAGTWNIGGGKPMADKLIYKDAEGNEFDQYDFLDGIHNWLDKNQDYLLRDSRDLYNELTKKRRVA